MEILEKMDAWQESYRKWQRGGRISKDPTGAENVSADYPFVENKRASFVPARRALPMLNLALISSAGAYIDGTEPFVIEADGDASLREIPIEIEAGDLRYVARGYNPQAVNEDMNAQIPLQRLLEFQGNGIIGQLNPAFWSFSGFIPDASRVVEQLAPRLVERVTRYEAQAALLIPASRLCHQSVGLVARALESAGIPTMMIAVDRAAVERVHPPRAGLYNGKIGSVAGLPKWPEHQRRVLDESLRLFESIDQVVIRPLTVTLETQVEEGRGER